MKKIANIEEIEFINEEKFYNEYVYKATPVIIKNGIKQWPAANKWSIDYLKEKIGQITVGYKHCPSNRHPDFNQVDKIQIKQGSFSEYAEQLLSLSEKERSQFFLSGDEMYFQFLEKINEALLPIRDDFSIPDLFPIEQLYKIGLWITAKGVHSWLHYDRSGAYNLNAQITGKKKVYLFKPEEATKLSMFLNSRAEIFNFSQIDITNPDFNKFPLCKEAEYIEGELDAGDLLFIPGYWLHAFDHLGDININVNFWWIHTLSIANPLSTRAAFLKAFWKEYGLNENDATTKLQNFLEANKELAQLFQQIELNFLK